MLKTFIFRYLCTLWSILAAAEHVPDNQVLISNWNCYLPLWQQAPCKDCKWSQATLVICVMISYCVEVELSEAGLQTLFCNECWIVYKWSHLYSWRFSSQMIGKWRWEETEIMTSINFTPPLKEACT